MFDLIGTIKKKTGLDDLFGDGMSVPKSVQDVIKIDAVYSDGIFMTGKDRYSKTFKFTDINYAVSSKEDKEANFLRYSEILNSLENGISSQITPDDEEDFYSIKAIKYNDRYLLSFEEENQLYRQESWPIVALFLFVLLIWVAFIVASIVVGRNPQKFSKKVVKMFFKDGYINY